jgi:hypothetical protein
MIVLVDDRRRIAREVVLVGRVRELGFGSRK